MKDRDVFEMANCNQPDGKVVRWSGGLKDAYAFQCENTHGQPMKCRSRHLHCWLKRYGPQGGKLRTNNLSKNMANTTNKQPAATATFTPKQQVVIDQQKSTLDTITDVLKQVLADNTVTQGQVSTLTQNNGGKDNSLVWIVALALGGFLLWKVLK